jgi:hypothetical protein
LRGKYWRCEVLWGLVALIGVHVGVRGLGSLGSVGEGSAANGQAGVKVFLCFDFGWAGGVEGNVVAFAVSAFRGGSWAAGWSGSEVALFGAAQVFASVLSAGVDSSADGACGGLVWACLVGMSKAVAVSTVGGSVSGVDGGDFADW